MIRNAILVAAALLLLPSIARAEFATPRNSGDVRPATAKRARFERVPARVAVVTTPRLTVDEVLTKINTIYMAGLQRCYRKSLVADPSYSGKVMLTFQVDEQGRVLMDMGANPFDQCVARAVVGWRFTAPTSENETHYRISLVLKSN